MPLFHLYADYNNDGVVGSSDHASRNTGTGVTLTPNLDAETGTLAAKISVGQPVVLDIDRNPKLGSDDDLISLVVMAEPHVLTSAYKVILKLEEYFRQKIRIYDDARRPLNDNLRNGFYEYELVFHGQVLKLFVEALTLNSSPTLPVHSSGADPEVIQLSLEVLDAQTGVFIENEVGTLSVSPLILLGDHAPAERLYMCDTIDNGEENSWDNTPSYKDVFSLQGRIPGTRFVSVPNSVHLRDSWLQDQFQIAYCQSATANMKVMLHLPRLRVNGQLLAAAGGLPDFVRMHFPSSGIGLFQDFWDRSFPVETSMGIINADIYGSAVLQIAFQKAISLHRAILKIISYVDPALYEKKFKHHRDDKLSMIVKGLPALKEKAVSILIQAETEEKNKRPLDPDKVNAHKLNREHIQEKAKRVLQQIALTDSEHVRVTYIGGLLLDLKLSTIDELEKRLRQIHSSHNYGGNIEVSPPLPGAPFGKILIGNYTTPNGSVMDVDLVSFLALQKVQPVVQIDTTWLKVGHVDEIVNFASGAGSGNGFSTVVASPAKAYRLLEEITLLNERRPGIPAKQQEKDIIDRLYTAPGNWTEPRQAEPHPVTHLLRGKHWLQNYMSEDGIVVMPPDLYTRMSSHYASFSTSFRPYSPKREAVMHFYNAKISVRELAAFSWPSNEEVIKKMEKVKVALLDAFPGSKLIELPVIFDTFPQGKASTIAFTPDLVNYQTLGDRILMPRPYGPRMSVEDVITVLRNVMGPSFSAFLTPQFLRRKNLHKTFHWAFKEIDQYNSTVNFGVLLTGIYATAMDLGWLAKEFQDGFPQETSLDEIKQKIRRANPGKFLPNGALINGWQKIEIPENKVDVFEAYTQIMMESMGITVDWVDSWFYHVNEGGIHCGTNVIRTPDFSPAKAWWKFQRRTV